MLQTCDSRIQMVWPTKSSGEIYSEGKFYVIKCTVSLLNYVPKHNISGNLGKRLCGNLIVKCGAEC